MHNMKKNRRKPILKEILGRNPKAYLVANKYKVLLGMLRRMYPRLFDLDAEGRRVFSEDYLEAFVFDAVNGNRDWQALTEGHDALNKKVLDQQWNLDNGYGPVHNSRRGEG